MIKHQAATFSNIDPLPANWITSHKPQGIRDENGNGFIGVNVH